MFVKIKLKNSTIILIGIFLVVIGFLFGFMEYLKQKKEKVFSDMNILLYESETPDIIDNDVNKEDQKEEVIQEKKEEKDNETITPTKLSQTYLPRYNYIGTLEIPKINVKRGFLNLGEKYNNVDYNVTVIQGSDFPDVKDGNLILAAHSGPCSYCYFDKLYKLSKGDIAYVTYGGVKYSYKIVDIYEVQKTGTVAIYRDYSKKVLTLITCTRNSKTKQTVYILENY